MRDDCVSFFLHIIFIDNDINNIESNIIYIMDIEPHDPNIIKCSYCQTDFALVEFRKHNDQCRETHSIPSLQLRRSQKYIKNGKLYTISNVERVIRRNKNSPTVNYAIVRLHCEEDQTSIVSWFAYNKRFRIDENNNIIIE
jgi:hypothetical protein